MAEPTTMIRLNQSQWDQYTAQTDRTKPSPYQGDVDAAKVGDRFAVPIPQDDDNKFADRSIVNNLHKAARSAGKNIQVLVRRTANPPAVLWTVREGEYVQPTRTPKPAVTPVTAEGDTAE